MATGLGLRDPWPADEPRFALVAQDMLRSGDWMIPRVGGDLYADKPPVFFWLMAASMARHRIAAHRLPAAVAARGHRLRRARVRPAATRAWSRGGVRRRPGAAAHVPVRLAVPAGADRRRAVLLHHAQPVRLAAAPVCRPAHRLVLRRLVCRRYRRHHQGRRLPAAAGADPVRHLRCAWLADAASRIATRAGGSVRSSSSVQSRCGSCR